MSNFPQYQVIKIVTNEPVQLPGGVIASNVTAFVLEQQTLATSSWGAAQFPNIGALQAYNNLPGSQHIYIVGSPWTNLALAQAAAVADFTALAAIRDGSVTAAQLQNAITTSVFASLISTVAGPG
jgi:hypothetical protein